MVIIQEAGKGDRGNHYGERMAGLQLPCRRPVSSIPVVSFL